MRGYPGVSLQRVLGPGAPANPPLHDQATTRLLEAAAAAADADPPLMQRAGAATARLALALAPHARRVWIAAGPGNNGGDGLDAAARLQAAGRDVTVSLAATASRPADAAAALGRAQAAGVRLTDEAVPPGALGADDLAIDALFGLGLKRPLDGWALAALRALNAAAVPVLAVDLPSGLDGDRGLRLGETVQARWTLSLLTLKPGLFTAEGRDPSGEIWFDALGVDAAGQPATARLLTDTRALWPRRAHAQHKGSFGDLWVVGGAAGMAGAARLAARAGLAAGAGRVFVVSLDPAAGALDAAWPELMHRPAATLQEHDTPLETATVVCGCGGGEAVAAPLPTLIARAGRLLLDADALNRLAADAALAPLMAARAARGRPTVLTPHPLEAARLLGLTTAQVQADRLAAAERLAERYRAVVLLKGSGSVIAMPGELPWINASGNAALASAGTGDVLAGWIGGLWAQGLEAAQAACLGARSHGLAADRWQALRAGPLTAGALTDALRELPPV